MSGERWVVSGLTVFAGLIVSACVCRTLDSAAFNSADAATQGRAERGLTIAPVPLNLIGKDRAMVGLGSYIVNAESACNDCHTNPPYESGHDPFKGGDGKVNASGYLKGGTNMGNGVTAPDLTPDAKGLPGGLTLEVFANAINSGHASGGPAGRILQVMPWPIYRQMTADDQRAVYEYLSAIPSSRAR